MRPTERQFQRQIADLAAVLGYVHQYHTWLSARSAPGFPDLVLCRPGDERRVGRLVLIEVKGPRGKLTDEQREWLAALASVPGVSAYCWRAGETTLEEIAETLREEWTL